MKTIAIIINGTSLPYHVIHHAINKAKNEKAEILALFLKGKHKTSKGYIFPSDISSSENSFFAGQVKSEDENLLSDNMKLVKRMIEDEDIAYQAALKEGASIDEVVELTKTTGLVIVDKNFDEDRPLTNDSISLDELQEKLTVPVEVLADNV